MQSLMVVEEHRRLRARGLCLENAFVSAICRRVSMSEVLIDYVAEDTSVSLINAPSSLECAPGCSRCVKELCRPGAYSQALLPDLIDARDLLREMQY